MKSRRASGAKVVSTYLSADEAALVDRLASFESITRSELLRQVLDEHLERRERRRLWSSFQDCLDILRQREEAA